MIRALAALALVAIACTTKSESVEVTKGSGSAKPTPTPAPAPPKGAVREAIEKSLSKNLSSYDFTTFTCPEVAPTATTAECTVSAANGVSIPVTVTPTTRDDKGSWKTWNVDLGDARVYTADRLAENLRPEMTAEVNKAYPTTTFELNCGPSPVLFKDHKATCKLILHTNPTQVHDVDIDNSTGNLKWKTEF